jgi:hypothetical protein
VPFCFRLRCALAKATEPVQEALEVRGTVAVPGSVAAAFRQLLARDMGVDLRDQPGLEPVTGQGNRQLGRPDAFLVRQEVDRIALRETLAHLVLGVADGQAPQPSGRLKGTARAVGRHRR